MYFSLVILVTCSFLTRSSLSMEQEDFDFGDIRKAILEHLEMYEVPTISEEDRNRVEIPYDKQKEYDLMRGVNRIVIGNEVHSRQTRSSGEPSLARLFRTVHKGRGKLSYTIICEYLSQKGRFLYSILLIPFKHIYKIK